MNKLKFLKLTFSFSMLFWLALSPIKVFAESNLDFYSSNDINFYNPDDCVDSGASSTTKDVVTTPDKKYGTSLVKTAGADHSWKPAMAADFGSASEARPTTYGEDTVSMDKAGVFYFSINPDLNVDTPIEIKDAVKSGKLKPKGKLIFKNGENYVIGAWLDNTPNTSNVEEKVWIDLGQNLAKALDLPGNGQTLASIKWDFISSKDVTTKAATAAASSTASASSSSIKYKLPATSGKTGYEEKIDSKGAIPSGGKVSFHRLASKGKEWQDYYITMRWTWTKWNWDGSNTTLDDDQFNWMSKKPRIILVTNKRNNKSIYAAALESGPGPWAGAKGSKSSNGWNDPQDGTPDKYTGRVSGLPPKAIDALDAKQGMSDGSGDTLLYQWATNQDVTPGPTDNSANASDCDGSSTSAAGEHGWDLTGDHKMVFYDQCSKPWVDAKFGFGSLCSCGCGPTSMAMIVATLTGDKAVDPKNMAAYYADNGGQSSGCGSNWNWSVISKKYAVKITDLGTNMTKAKAALDKGGLVLFAWSGAPFTNGGHIMVMRKYDPEGRIFIASSGGQTNRKQSDKAWDEKIFEKGFSGSADGRSGSGNLKGLWEFEKK